jgi:hypothetical protein
MRTTIDLNDELLEKAKQLAARERTSLKAIVERALRSHLSRRRAPSGYRLQWRPERGRLQTGVQLDDRDALFDLMDGRS